MKKQQIIQVPESAQDAFIIGVSTHPENHSHWEELDLFIGKETKDWLTTSFVSSKKGEVTYVPHPEMKQVIAVGIGAYNQATADDLREVFAAVGKAMRKKRCQRVTIDMASFSSKACSLAVAELAGEGIYLGQYVVSHYKTAVNVADYQIEQISLWATEEAAVDFYKGKLYAEATNRARDLVNCPPNILTATVLGEIAEAMDETYDNLTVQVLKKKEIETLGMGALLAVNKGSVEEPRLLVLTYEGDPFSEDKLALVGKGITYDTGGYSLKPKDGMVGMKGDMGGAAAVLQAMTVVSELAPEQNVVAVIAATDNMINGQALKPDDVITSMSGKTIEVLNTDAEGRLVLADAVTYAIQEGATEIIDVATLTGGVIVALGMDKTGCLTNDEAFFASYREAAQKTGEFIWQLPLTESDRKRIRTSDMADLNNSPGRDGHMIFAGGFVGEFVGQLPWIHLDIAGTSMASKSHTLGPAGGTGVMVRTLAKFIEERK